jgi:type II secretory pathway pseudopilin PulG
MCEVVLKERHAMDGPIVSCSARVQAGFTYVGVLMLLALASLTATATVGLGALMERRAAEEELLRIGAEFDAAFRSYLASGNSYPPDLQSLVADARFPQPRRHLRQIYADPITGQAQWGLVSAPTGRGIAGVYSLSGAVPIKLKGFDPDWARLEQAKTYRDWVFGALGDR